MKQRARVALIVETSGGYGRQILRGISRYLKTHGGWSVFVDEGECIRPLPDWLPGWDGDGVICRATTPELAEALKSSNISAVNLSNNLEGLGIPHVISDMPAIGRMAAEHLMERGFRTLAYVGFDNQPWSEQRLAGVREALHGRGILHDAFETSSLGYRSVNWENELEELSNWVKALPHPIGIVACSDRRGQHVLEACRMAGVSVPEEVAVIGVDNIETFCELCQPALSSVMPDGERAGYEAAALLSRLMQGNGPKNPQETILIPPKGVAARLSTEAWALDDPVLCKAIHFIREHACDEISVNDVVQHVNTSRSTLERAFRNHFGHSPQHEIRQVRLKRVKQLLEETELAIPQIAEIAGFKHPEYLTAQFKRLTGVTTSQWREKSRA